MRPLPTLLPLPLRQFAASLLRRLQRDLIAPMRFLLMLLIPLSLFDAVRLGHYFQHPNFFAYWPLIVNFGLLTLIDYAVGKDSSQPQDSIRQVLAYRWITFLSIPVHIAALCWGLVIFSQHDLNWIGQIGWIMSVGAVSGTLAITTAHELIHKNNRLEQYLGGFLLSSVCYGGFKIEHIDGHHVHVATPQDASTARYGESVYAFLPRAIWHNACQAWRLENRRIQRQRRLFWQHEVLFWHGLSLCWMICAYAFFGGAGVIFFIAQSVVAFTELEIINYVEHYGLTRKLMNGRYERVNTSHSWNSSYRLQNWFLLNLARHADHHAHAAKRYQELRHIESAPQLPGGYGAMVLLALIPPLWFRVIHPRMASGAWSESTNKQKPVLTNEDRAAD